MKKLICTLAALVLSYSHLWAGFTFIPSVAAAPREGVNNTVEGVDWQAWASNRMQGLATSNPSVGTGYSAAVWKPGGAVNYRELITSTTLSRLWRGEVPASGPSEYGNRTHFGGTIIATDGWKINLAQTTFHVQSFVGSDDNPILGNIDTTASMLPLNYFRRAYGLSGGMCDRVDYGGVGVGFTANSETAIGQILRYCYNNRVRFKLTVVVGGTDSEGSPETQTFVSWHGLAWDEVARLTPVNAGTVEVEVFDPTLQSAGLVVCVQSSSDLLSWSRRADGATTGVATLMFGDASVFGRQFYRLQVCPVQATLGLKSLMGASAPSPDGAP